MKKAGELFLLDWKRIFKSKAATLLMLALLIIPSLYCWFNVWALWDPYSNTSDLKVAVYSADKSTKFQGQEVAVGKQLVKELRKNDQMGWTFVSSKKAIQDGVRSGKYYAGIYVPKNFSSDLMSFVAGKIKKPKLSYYVNEKINAVAPKLTGTGASTLQTTIGSEFQETVADTLMKTMNKAGVDLDDNLPMLRRMASLILNTNANLPELDKYVAQAKQLQKDMPTIKAKLKQANELAAYMPEVNKLAKKIVAVNGYLPQVESAGELATTVAGKIPEIKQAGAQLQTVNNDFDTISGTLDSAITTANSALGVLTKVDKLLPEITATAQDTQQVVGTTKDEIIPEIEKVLPALKTAVVSGVTMLTNLNTTVSSNLTSLSDKLATLEDDPDNQEARQALVDLLSGLSTDSQTGATTATKLADSLQSLQDAYNKSAVANGQSEVHTLDQGITQLRNAATVLKQLSQQAATLSTQAKTASTAELQKGLTTLADTADKFAAVGKKLEASQLPSKIATFNKQFKQLLADASVTLSDLNKNVLPELPSILSSTKTVIKRAVTLMTKYQKQMPALKQELSDANTLLNGHMDEITTGLTTVSDLYKNDYPTLKNKLATATSFINNDLPDIESELTGTLTTLNEKLPEAEKALTEANKLLDKNWPTIREGITKGAKLVAKGEKSVDFEKLIRLLKRDAGKESDFLANPVTLKTKSYYGIPTYGSASAPFYTALCMWVGGLLLSSILVTDYALNDQQKKRYNMRHRFAGRFLTFAVMGMLQALIVALGNMWLVHAYVAEPVAFVAAAIFLDLMFTGILYALVALFGNIGKGLGIIILVLSISGAGGNFPIQLSGAFFQMINPWLPFTYAVNLIRETVGGIYWPNMWQDIIVLTLYGVGFFIAGLLLKEPVAPIMDKIHANAIKSKIIH